MPDLTGRTIVVTGANSGLGLVTTRELARAGATVVMACRNREKGQAAREGILAELPDARLELGALDLGDLSSVQMFAKSLGDRPLDVLVNNAGLMAVPWERTRDGFEIQMGTNHLGHFALTGRLLPSLIRTPGARVVTLSSAMAYYGKLDTLDRGRYSAVGLKRWRAYSDSKLANVTFALELDRRTRAAGVDLVSVSAHPGYASTELQTKHRGKAEDLIMTAVNATLAQPAAMGALPTLYAATAPGVVGGLFFGPDGLGAMRGHPTTVTPPRLARKPEVGARLWERSVELTGVAPTL